jgi:hypothetical protein
MKRLLLALMATGALVAGTGAQSSTTRSIHINVIDEEGAPVTGLSASDLAVTENGETRSIARVSGATDPLKLAIVLDDRALYAPPVRASVRTFAQTMAAHGEVGLFSYSRPDWTVLDFTRDAATVDRAVESMAAMPSRSNDPEGLLQTLARRFHKQETPRPVVVVLTFGAPDCAPRNCPASESPRWDLVIQDLQRAGTTVYAVGVNPIEPAHLVYASADATGGSTERLITDTAVAQAMQRTAEQILSQQTVTYSTSDAPRGGFKLKVSATRPGLRVRAPEKVY